MLSTLELSGHLRGVQVSVDLSNDRLQHHTIHFFGELLKSLSGLMSLCLLLLDWFDSWKGSYAYFRDCNRFLDKRSRARGVEDAYLTL